MSNGDRSSMGAPPGGFEPEDSGPNPAGEAQQMAGGKALVPFKLGPTAVGPVPSVPGQGPDFNSLLIAFRRRWALALLLGVLGAAIGVGLTWKFVPSSKYTARALIRVATTPPKIVFETHEPGTNYFTYQRTQITLVKSRMVINSAIRDPKVAALTMIKEQSDPVEWLEKALVVDFPGGSEILQVTLSGDRPDELAGLVNAVIESYMQNIVRKEASDRVSRQMELKKIYDKYQSNLESKRKMLKELAEQLGSSDKQTLALKQQFNLDHMAQTKSELLQIQSELRRAEIEMSTLEAEGFVEGAYGRGVDSFDGRVEAQVESHPTIVNLKAHVAQLKRHHDDASRIAAQQRDPAVVRAVQEYNAARKNLAAAREKIKAIETAKLREQGDGGQSPVAMMRRKINVLKAIELSMSREIEGLGANITTFGKEALDLQSQQDQMELMDETAKRVGSLVEAIEVEYQAPPRIEILDRAEAPRTKDETKKLKLTAAGGLGVFSLVVLGITFWESKARRIHAPEEVVRALGMKIFGALPSMPSPGRRRWSKAAEDQDRRNCSAMTESINAARTMLLHASRAESIRVVMITSALKGEGKTSLSGHLAASLARAGNRTLLIDCDLRSPAIHRLFDLDHHPGISEVLRGEARGIDVIRATVPGGPWVITAGQADARAIQMLALDELDAIFGELKKEFDYILVDSAPVLPVADSLLISQHVDAVIFSILRDVSRIPKVYAAYERLAVLGVRMLGAVVSGADHRDGHY